MTGLAARRVAASGGGGLGMVIVDSSTVACDATLAEKSCAYSPPGPPLRSGHPPRSEEGLPNQFAFILRAPKKAPIPPRPQVGEGGPPKGRWVGFSGPKLSPG